MLNVSEFLPTPAILPPTAPSPAASLNMLRFFLFNSRNCLNFYFRMCDLISVANGCQGGRERAGGEGEVWGAVAL